MKMTSIGITDYTRKFLAYIYNDTIVKRKQKNYYDKSGNEFILDPWTRTNKFKEFQPEYIIVIKSKSQKTQMGNMTAIDIGVEIDEKTLMKSMKE